MPTYRITDDGCLMEYNCQGQTHVELPEGIKRIGPNYYAPRGVFQNMFNSKVESVVIPEGVEAIGYNSFRDCENLKSVTLPGTLKIIEGSAFFNCKALEEITLPEGLETIGEYAFSGCVNLKKIHMPASLTTLKDFGFSHCTALSEVSGLRPELLKEYGIFVHCDGLADEKGFIIVENTLYDYLGSEAEVTIPDTVTRVGGAVFSRNETLVSAYIPDSVKQLSNSMFNYCESLTSVRLPAGIPELPYSIFSSCTALTRLEVPTGVETIGNYAFTGCTALEEIILPDTVTKISQRAFGGCTALSRINLPMGLKTIEADAFNSCIALEQVEIPDSVRELCGFVDCEKLEPVKIPAKLKKIGNFRGCKKFTHLMLPAGVEAPWGGFDKKMLIHSAKLFSSPWEPNKQDSNLWAQAPVIFSIGTDGKLEYKILLCYPFEKLKTFDKKGNLNWKTYDALLCGKDLKLATPFGTLAMLYRLRWPQELEEERRQLFIAQITKDLKKVAPFVNLCPEDGLIGVLEENGILTAKNKKTILPLMGIGEAPTPKKAAKKEEALPEGVKTPAQIKKEWGTKKLEDGTLWLTSYKGTDTVVEVPAVIGSAAVTVVGKECFSCSNWGRATKEQVASRKKITSVIIPEGITRIEEDAFWECVGLESVQLPSTLKAIGTNAFSRCKNLKQINLADGVELGDHAFSGCAGLMDEKGMIILGGVLFNVYKNQGELVIPDSVKRINPGAIRELPDLQSVVFPEGITRLPGQTISYCPKITHMTIPASVNDIHYSAFSGIRHQVTVHGWTGSAAEEFCARQYGWKFESLGVIQEEETDFVIRDEVLLEYKGNDETVVIPEGVKIIGLRKAGWSGVGAFADNKTLRHLVIPEGVEYIDAAFYGCENLETIQFPDSLTDVSSRALNYTKWYKAHTAGPVYAGAVMIGYVPYADRAQEPETLVIAEGIRTIANSAMYSALGFTRKVVLPSTLEAIGESAFGGNHSLEEMVAPAALREIGDYAFDSVTLKHCSGGALHKTEKLSAKFKIFYTGDPIDTAWLTLYQGEQTWRKAVREKIDSHPEIVAPAMEEMARLICAMEVPEKTILNRAAAFAQELCKAAMGEPVKALYDALKAKNFVGLKKMEANEEFMACLEGGAKEDLSLLHPIEAKVVEAMKPTPAFDKVLERIIETVPYAGTGIQCAPRVLAFVVYEYIRQYDPDSAKYISTYETACTAYEKSAIADEVAASLDQNKLIDVLRQMAERHEGEYYIPYARYADDKTAVSILSQMQKWDHWGYFGAVGRKHIIIARSGLMLNDTKAAMIHMDKVGQLGAYARMRGTDADTLRDTVLADFGFDENRQIRYDLGGNIAVISMDTELNLTIFDTNANKIVKSIPKKGADDALHAQAKSAFSDLKKNIKKVITNRKHLLFADFLSGAVKDAEHWRQAYEGNPVLNSVARLIVWKQGENTFTMTLEGPVDSAGSAYTITDEPIGVAHPIEMRSQIAAWQTYFTEKGLKQPFEQIWEPAYDPSDIKPDRYQDSSLNVYRLQHKDAHGIHAWGLEAYSESYGFELTDCKMEQDASEWRFVSGITDDATFHLGKFTFEKFTRYVNHIVYLFDKWTITDRLLRDDTSIEPMLAAFTAAQIREFLTLTTEKGCSNVTAMLLEYQNQHFADMDPMAAFTLDW